MLCIVVLVFIWCVISLSLSSPRFGQLPIDICVYNSIYLLYELGVLCTFWRQEFACSKADQKNSNDEATVRRCSIKT